MQTNKENVCNLINYIIKDSSIPSDSIIMCMAAGYIKKSTSLDNAIELYTTDKATGNFKKAYDEMKYTFNENKKKRTSEKELTN